MAPLKKKGDLAELKVATDLIDRGCQISIPFGEDCDYDLIADYDGRLHRVQVKYTRSDGQIVLVRCRSHSLTNGKVRVIKLYTKEMVDWIAVYDCTTERCYYCPSSELGEGRNILHLRLQPARTASASGYGTLPTTPTPTSAGIVSGASRDRTGDLLIANQTLCQLSYGPVLQIVGRFRPGVGATPPARSSAGSGRQGRP
jgi:hypothetical protein